MVAGRVGQKRSNPCSKARPVSRRGFQMAYGRMKMPEPEELEKFGQRWKPYRTLAARYSWRAVDEE